MKLPVAVGLRPLRLACIPLLQLAGAFDCAETYQSRVHHRRDVQVDVDAVCQGAADAAAAGLDLARAAAALAARVGVVAARPPVSHGAQTPSARAVTSYVLAGQRVTLRQRAFHVQPAASLTTADSPLTSPAA